MPSHAIRRFISAFLLAFAAAAEGADDYELTPDSLPQSGVPQGVITKFTWTESRIFTNTSRSWWTYVPAQYSPAQPACLMVFQDGGGYVKTTNGSYRVPVVFDNLIRKKEMPVTIGLFIDPGDFPAKPGEGPRLRPDGTPTTRPETAASNTIHSGTLIPGSCSRKSSRKSNPNITSPKIRKAVPFVVQVRAESVPGQSPGNGPINSAKFSAPLAASQTFGAAMFIPRSFARPNTNRSVSSFRTDPMTWIINLATGPWPTSKWLPP